MSVGLRWMWTSYGIFNLGFYAVIPFLATVLRDDYAAAGLMVALVLGARTATQQGLFFFAGAASDRFGAKRLIIAGCVTRTLGFALMGLSGTLPGFIAGVVLSGVGGALFTPAIQAAVSALAQPGPAAQRRAFSMLNLTGEVGAVLGPLVGVLLLAVDFTAVSLFGAAIFATMGAALGWWLPGADLRRTEDSVPSSWREPLRDRAFVSFVAAASVLLVAYNQLYIALPIELERAGLDESQRQSAIGILMAYASALVLLAQLPVTRLMSNVPLERAQRRGLLIVMLAFLAVAAAAPWSWDGWAAVIPSAVFVTLLIGGYLIAQPAIQARVASFGQGSLGARYGLLGTAGGIGVMVSGLLGGLLLDAAHVPGLAASLPWLFHAAWLLAVVAWLTLRRPAEPVES